MRHPIVSTLLISIALVLVLSLRAFSQSSGIFAIQSLPLEVSATKTVSLSFSAPVKTIDRGTPELLAQKAKGTENVVLLKAAKTDARPTTLIVITTDGELHSFEVNYRDNPSATSFTILSKGQKPVEARISDDFDQVEIAQGLALAIQETPNIFKRQTEQHFSAVLTGLYVQGPIIYLRLIFKNESAIDYDLETLRVFHGDKKGAKRSASQQYDLEIVGKSYQVNQVKAGEMKTTAIAVPKFTLSKNKHLLITVTESDGARHLKIRLKRRDLSRIQPL